MNPAKKGNGIDSLNPVAPGRPEDGTASDLHDAWKCYQAAQKRAEAAEAKLRKLEREMRRLLNKVNRVTSAYRHHGEVSHIAALCDRQIDVEAALKAAKEEW